MGLLLRHRMEMILLILLLAFVFLTYSPADQGYFWIYWVNFSIIFHGTCYHSLFIRYIVHGICIIFLWNAYGLAILQ